VQKPRGRPLKDSRNYQKARDELAYLHRKASRRRDDLIGCVSSDVVKNHDLIAVERLNIRGLLKNHKLAMAISDAGWYKFQTALAQKTASTEKVFIRVPAKDTTQRCNQCGYTCYGDDKVILGQDEWICPQCGTHHLRNVNAAINILEKGLLISSEA
jgi:putative transposase